MYKKYEKMKDSGVDWIGVIPEKWGIIDVKYAISIPVTDGPHETPEFIIDGIPFLSVDSIQNGKLVFDNCRFISEAAHKIYKNKSYPRKFDILMGKAASIGKIAMVDVDFEFNIWSPLALIRFAHQKLLPLFGYYTFTSYLVQDQINTLSNLNTQFNIGMKDIKNIVLLQPPLPEQKAIAAFLDHETSRIDKLIEKKERLIDLLKEKRQALITRAVTKGLDPDVKMKDSGVEWIGEIPEHWEISIIKRYAERIQTGSTPPTIEERYYVDGTIPWYGPGSFGEHLILTKPVKFISETAYKDKVLRLFKDGSIMIVCIGATVGKVGYIDKPASSNQQITAISFNEDSILSKFAAHLIKTYEPFIHGIAPQTTLPIIDNQEVGALPLLIPPKIEQKKIIEHIESKLETIDKVCGKILIQIDKLRELRQTLISDAVTGKIDVRHFAEPSSKNR